MSGWSPIRHEIISDDDLCRHCDVFIGWGAIGVVRQPEHRDDDWLASHCWLCGRSREEIRQAQR